jgi:predicted esterase
LPRAVVNFVGGWLGTGCPTATAVNQNLFNRGITFGQPTIWLYGEKDPFCPLSHSQANFAAFQAAGGKAAFHDYVPPEGLNGHQIGAAPQLWGATLEAYLADRGLPTQMP